jgi:hypothetical protein
MQAKLAEIAVAEELARRQEEKRLAAIEREKDPIVLRSKLE